MSEEKKIFVGSGKKKFDNLRQVSVCLTDLQSEYIFEYNGKKYIKLNVNDKKEADQYGKDIAVSIDTWKPTTQEAKPTGMSMQSTSQKLAESNDLPF
jgi:hypothetical protein